MTLHADVRPEPRRHQRATGVSTAFGTFGELLQGVDEDGVDFLVTLPIARWSTAMFVTEPDRPGIRVSPLHKHKAVRLARAILSTTGLPGGGSLTLHSTLPEGKGLASSSADLVATARAVGNALGVPMPPSVIEALLRPIEPSDGVMYEGVTSFSHRRVRLRARLCGPLPPLTVVGLDEGGTVDTMAFNQRPKPFGPAERREYGELLAALELAVAAGDPVELGRISTRSAEVNQDLLPKRTFSMMRSVAEDLGALGVVVAHSGSMVGVLISRTDPEYDRKRNAARQACLALAGNVTVDDVLTFRSPCAGPGPAG